MTVISSTKNDLILKDLTKYYTENFHVYKKFIKFVNKESNIPIRIIEHFIINYSKNNTTMFMKKDMSYFIVYVNYKNMLKVYHKEYFDPFRRKNKINDECITFKIKDLEIKTAICQLNFFRWVFQNEIDNYVELHFDKIEKDLLASKK